LVKQLSSLTLKLNTAFGIGVTKSGCFWENERRSNLDRKNIYMRCMLRK